MRQKAGRKTKDEGLFDEKEMAIGYIGKVADQYGRERFSKYSLCITRAVFLIRRRFASGSLSLLRPGMARI
jgi:hypothetical protein